jgi:hypothetical protein
MLSDQQQTGLLDNQDTREVKKKKKGTRGDREGEGEEKRRARTAAHLG